MYESTAIYGAEAYRDAVNLGKVYQTWIIVLCRGSIVKCRKHTTTTSSINDVSHSPIIGRKLGRRLSDADLFGG